MASIITQVQHTGNTINERKSKQHLPSLISLSLRGARINLDKDTLLELPESMLVVMFPHGFVLDGQEDSKDRFCTVDFNMDCLLYVLDYFEKAKSNFKSDEFAQDAYLAHAVVSGIPLNPLLTKQAIVVLREELEFFLVLDSISPSLKQKSGEWLVQQNLVFEALLKNDKDADDNGENRVAEHHLIDMLCHAGFSKKDHWHHRSTEPNKTSVSSLSLVSLTQASRMAVGQKLIMFWRKPARKCWWSKSMADIDNQLIKLWCRRTWTLELILL
ncbi:uncharacterized protein EV154DRAFT_524453 [Mucor mucedo]|uniref:uncharacterized protein n=1 Tax=Mucor mucedo TaxID=29922 RepID=UPI002220CAAA|nr:uncharacterized protein EV154DRAFT_524453 [Mucor mucedo]KAI7879549.1 hypothetical protein EV154DRAFT_524453 [Mucor mucedo]